MKNFYTGTILITGLVNASLGFITNAGTDGSLAEIGSTADADFVPARVSGGIVAIDLNTVGKNLIGLVNPSAISFIKIAADNSTSTRTPFQTLQDINSRQTFSDANVTVTAGTTVLAQVGTVTATRVVTFPAASSYPNGTGFWIVDEGGGLGPTKRFTCTKTGSDSVNGGSTYAVVRTPVYFVSNGSNLWTGNTQTVLLTPATSTITFQGPAAGTGYTITIPDSDWSAARTDTGQTFTGIQIFTAVARTSGTASYFTFNGAADTGITANNESVGVDFSAVTRTFEAGNITIQRERYFRAPTYNKTGISTAITTAVSVEIDAPIAGTATITNKFCLRTNGIIAIGTATSTPSIRLMPDQPTGSGGWIDMSTGGSSGIGSGGPGTNPWIAYVSGSGHWFTGSVVGDIAYRNTGGRILMGTSTGLPDLVFVTTNGAGTVSNLEARGTFKSPAIATGGVSCMDVPFF